MRSHTAISMVNRCSWQGLSFWQDFEIQLAWNHSLLHRLQISLVTISRCWRQNLYVDAFVMLKKGYENIQNCQQHQMVIKICHQNWCHHFQKIFDNFTANTDSVNSFLNSYSLLECSFVPFFFNEGKILNWPRFRTKYACISAKNLLEKYVMQIKVNFIQI